MSRDLRHPLLRGRSSLPPEMVHDFQNTATAASHENGGEVTFSSGSAGCRVGGETFAPRILFAGASGANYVGVLWGAATLL